MNGDHAATTGARASKRVKIAVPEEELDDVQPVSTTTAMESTPSAAVAIDDPSSMPAEYICRAQDAITFKIVSSASEIDHGPGFHPVFTHQLFDDEQIRGYKNLNVTILKSALRMETYLGITFDEKLPNADDVLKILGDRITHPYTTNLADFIKQLQSDQDFALPGVKRSEYRVSAPAAASAAGSQHAAGRSARKRAARISSDDEAGSDTGPASSGLNDVVYEIRLGQFSDAGMKELHARIQFFLLFFIDASSYIDAEDAVWEILLLFERRPVSATATAGADAAISKRSASVASAARSKTSSTGSNGVAYAYSFVGYVTLYKFFAFPDSTRLRLSQIFVLPTHQRKGHGQKLLAEVYALAHERAYLEVNVEDPAPGFQFMRDLLDLRNCVAGGYFGQFTRGSRAHKVVEWDDEKAEGIHKALRITKDQVRRCYEALKLDTVNRTDEEEYKNYRLEVKARLYKQNQEELSTFSADARKEKLQEMYSELERTYEALLRKLHSGASE